MIQPALIDFFGWLPGIIFPLATLIQLFAIVKSGSARGVSWVTWGLFGIANIGLYIYTEKYTALQPIIGMLGTAVLDFIIAGFAIRDRKRQT